MHKKAVFALAAVFLAIALVAAAITTLVFWSNHKAPSFWYWIAGVFAVLFLSRIDKHTESYFGSKEAIAIRDKIERDLTDSVAGAFPNQGNLVQSIDQDFKSTTVVVSHAAEPTTTNHWKTVGFIAGSVSLFIILAGPGKQTSSQANSSSIQSGAKYAVPSAPVPAPVQLPKGAQNEKSAVEAVGKGRDIGGSMSSSDEQLTLRKLPNPPEPSKAPKIEPGQEDVPALPNAPQEPTADYKSHLSTLTPDENRSIEAVCMHDKYQNGPTAYNRCRERQLASLASEPSRPDLSALTRDEQRSIEAVCMHDKYQNGPAAYNRCLGRHLAALKAS